MKPEEIIGTVLGNEATCRVYLKELEKRGVSFSIPIDSMTHEECVEVGVRIYTELLKDEKDSK